MNRNTVSRFSLAPTISAPRSTMDLSHKHCDSFNVGELCPITIPLEVLPGDTWKIKTSKVCRMQTLKTPMYDDVFLDQYWFFIPDRLIWDHWREFMGENNDSAWIPEVTYSVPQIESPATGWNVGTIADHFGIPPLVTNLSVSALPFRAFALVYDQWFRSEVVQDPLVINTGDSTVTGTNGTSYITDTALGGMPPIVNRTYDLFSGCLISPQKGDPVSLAIGQPSNFIAPVYAAANPNKHFWDGLTTSDSYTAYKKVVNNSYPEMYEIKDAPKATNFADVVAPKVMQTDGNGVYDATWQTYGVMNVNNSTNHYPTQLQGNAGSLHSFQGIKISDAGVFSDSHSGITPVNLVADVDSALQMINVNDLRQAFQVQRWLERAAYGGSRYIET